MLLALDARNGETQVGFRAEGAWAGVYRFGTGRGSDEYAFLLESAAAKSGAKPNAAWISSVAPAFTPVLKEAIRSAFGLEALVVGPGLRTGVRIRTDNPGEVGSDLVCMAAAAKLLAPGPCVVVDFGAVLSFSAVDAQGDLLGAALAPGPGEAVRALKEGAAQLPEVRLQAPERAIGRNTVQSMRSGIFLGYQGLVDRLVERMRDELGAMATVLGTGDELGMELLSGQEACTWVPNLALEGLCVIAGRNAPAGS